jgi:hypothetical protein
MFGQVLGEFQKLVTRAADESIEEDRAALARASECAKLLGDLVFVVSVKEN